MFSYVCSHIVVLRPPAVIATSICYTQAVSKIPNIGQGQITSSISTTAHCGLWPVEQCPFHFFLSATNSLHLLTTST